MTKAEPIKLTADSRAVLKPVFSERLLRALDRGEGVIVYAENLNRIISQAARRALAGGEG